MTIDRSFSLLVFPILHLLPPTLSLKPISQIEANHLGFFFLHNNPTTSPPLPAAVLANPSPIANAALFQASNHHRKPPSLQAVLQPSSSEVEDEVFNYCRSYISRFLILKNKLLHWHILYPISGFKFKVIFVSFFFFKS